MARWKGRARLRRILRQLPDETRDEIATVFESRAPGILGYARARTPVKSGRGRQLLDAKVSRRMLRFSLGLLTKARREAGFYLNILDRGRRPRTVIARRRNPGGGVTRYAMRVRAIPGARYDIVLGRVAAHAMNTIGIALRGIWPRVLSRFAGGGYGD